LPFDKRASIFSKSSEASINVRFFMGFYLQRYK
jgi:hypothetical protein